jgi:hypothetical protein
MARVLGNNPARLEERRYAALAAEVIGSIRGPRRIPHDDEWKNIKYASTSNTLGEIVGAHRVQLIEDPTWSDKAIGLRVPLIKLSDEGRTMMIRGNHFEDWLWELLRDFQMMLEGAELVRDTPYQKGWKYVWLASCREQPEDVVAGEDVLKVVLRGAAAKNYGRARRTIPCSRRFIAMAFAHDAQSKLWYVDRVHPRLRPRAVFPFRVDSDDKLSLTGIEKLITWTYENRLDQSTTEIDVARAVLDLVQTADIWLRDEWADRVDYSAEELRRKLRKTYGSGVLPDASGPA